MKTVCRVEHPDYENPSGVRLGPFAIPRDCPLNEKTKFVRDSKAWNMPEPAQDGLEYIDDNEYCGFGNLETALYWMESIIEKLSEIGYVLAEYTIDGYRAGRHQVLFEAIDATHVKDYPLSILRSIDTD